MSGDYISRESVLALAKDICVLTKWDSEYRHRSIDPQDVRELPAADVVERKTGKWTLNKDGSATCSECGRVQQNAWDMDNADNFCHFCGAKME